MEGDSTPQAPTRINQVWFHVGMLVLGAWLWAFGIFLAMQGPSSASPLASSFYVVVPLVLTAGGAAVFSLFRFPYAIVISAQGLEVLYIHRRQHVPASAIRSLELRGEYVNRTVWLVRRDGTEEPLGLRNPRVVRAWESLTR